MKKNLVLFTLFILPLVCYLFFASGVNSFVKLPVITNKIPEISSFKALYPNEKVMLTNKITILGFVGDNFESKKGNFFNLLEKIYKKNKEFKDFQIVFIAQDGTQEQSKIMIEKLKQLDKTVNWKFVFGNTAAINDFYAKMNLQNKLDTNLGTTNVYIIDKERNLRGRKGKIKNEEEYKEGYNTSMVSELHNELVDDVKIILAEYRLALKKYKANRKKHGL